MKKYIVSLGIISALLFTTQLKAQQAETYEKANAVIDDLLKDPDISASDKETLKEALKENTAAINELKSSDAPIYSSDPPKNNTTNYDHAPAALQPKATKEINGNNNRGNGRTLISSNGN